MGVWERIRQSLIRRARDPGQHLVKDQQHVVPRAAVAEDLQIFLGRRHHAAGVADRLQDHRRHQARRDQPGDPGGHAQVGTDLIGDGEGNLADVEDRKDLGHVRDRHIVLQQHRQDRAAGGIGKGRKDMIKSGGHQRD